jgi:hypothetical protein
LPLRLADLAAIGAMPALIRRRIPHETHRWQTVYRPGKGRAQAPGDCQRDRGDAGRIYIETINGQFLFKEAGTPEEYRAGLACAITKGWLWKHESGTYVKFTPVGAEMFA